MATLEELKQKIGQEIGVSDWVDVTQDRINVFADVTEDHQFIHIDEEKAKKLTPFGGTIAHGFLSMSLLSAFAATGLPGIDGTKMGMNYGLNKLRFTSIVPSGSRVRGRFSMVAAEEKNPGQFLMTYGVLVEVEGAEKPALVCEWLSLVFV